MAGRMGKEWNEVRDMFGKKKKISSLLRIALRIACTLYFPIGNEGRSKEF